MTIYEDEWAFWDDIAGRYILKHSGADMNTDKVVKAASHYADVMVVERRKRKRVRNAPEVAGFSSNKSNSV